MAKVTLEKKIAQDLVDSKLRYILHEIKEILDCWHYSSTDTFIADARKGVIEEAEEDAITLRHLLDQREDLYHIKQSWVD